MSDRRGDRAPPVGLEPQSKRPPGATKGFMMRPGALLEGEQRLRRELKILEYQVKSRQIDRSTAIERGHFYLERHLEASLIEVDEAVADDDLGKVDRGAHIFEQLLEEAKRKWEYAIDDLLAL